MLKMFKLKKVVDERQEMELMQTERMGFWTMYWLLLASFLYQSLFTDAPFSQYAAEFIIFMFISFFTGISFMRKGQWDYYSKPGIKGYLIYSFVGSGLFTIISLVSKIIKYPNVQEHVWTVGLPIAAIIFVNLFILIFITLAISGHFTEKRRKKLEREFELEQDAE